MCGNSILEIMLRDFGQIQPVKQNVLLSPSAHSCIGSIFSIWGFP